MMRMWYIKFSEFDVLASKSIKEKKEISVGVYIVVVIYFT